MRQTRVFNHELGNVSDAIGMSESSFQQMKDITFDAYRKATSPSQIAEYLHEKADYDQILLMATYGVMNTMEEFGKMIQQKKGGLE